jgi:hypothetical protein
MNAPDYSGVFIHIRARDKHKKNYDCVTIMLFINILM